MTLVLRSLPAKTIPRTLPVTLKTANDHIRAIFARAGLGSRGDLMATARSLQPSRVTQRDAGMVARTYVLSSPILLRTSDLDHSHRFHRDLPGLVRDPPQLHPDELGPAGWCQQHCQVNAVSGR